MIVVLDSNIWISQLGLNSPVGTAVRFFIKKRKAQLALPEVIRLETENNLRDRLNGHISKIRENYSALLTAFGQLKEIVLPDERAVDKKVAEVFAGTGLAILDIPFSVDAARDSFIRTVRKLPPSDRSQQFRDGLIWADCLTLLKQDDVFLVTEDTDFYQDHDNTKGLSKVLAEEIEHAEHTLKLLSSLGKLLEDIRVDVSLDENLLVTTFLEQNKESVEQILSKNGFEALGRPKVEGKVFATENPSMMYVSFAITYECRDITEEGRFGGSLRVQGDGFYNNEAGSFEQLKSYGEDLTFKLKDGSEKQVRNVVLRVAGITMGHKEVTHTVRYGLD